MNALFLMYIGNLRSVLRNTYIDACMLDKITDLIILHTDSTLVYEKLVKMELDM